MKTTSNGSCYTVRCSTADVHAFAQQWPCFGPVRPIWFQFEKRTGDLVDIQHANTHRNDPAGVLALSNDAMWHGADTLGLDLPRPRSLTPSAALAQRKG